MRRIGRNVAASAMGGSRPGAASSEAAGKFGTSRLAATTEQSLGLSSALRSPNPHPKLVEEAGPSNAPLAEASDPVARDFYWMNEFPPESASEMNEKLTQLMSRRPGGLGYDFELNAGGSKEDPKRSPGDCLATTIRNEAQRIRPSSPKYNRSQNCTKLDNSCMFLEFVPVVESSVPRNAEGKYDTSLIRTQLSKRPTPNEYAENSATLNDATVKRLLMGLRLS
jgi:hypothetical protein